MPFLWMLYIKYQVSILQCAVLVSLLLSIWWKPSKLKGRKTIFLNKINVLKSHEILNWVRIQASHILRILRYTNQNRFNTYEMQNWDCEIVGVFAKLVYWMSLTWANHAGLILFMSSWLHNSMDCFAV